MLHIGKKSFIFTKKHSLPISSEISFTLLSHAHWDHLRYCKNSSKQNIFCSFETAELIKHIFSKKVNPWPYKHELKFDNISLRLFPSGHVLGSAQFFVQTPKTNFIITNDFKLEDSLLMKGAEILEGENLIIETTFAKPEFKFPKRELLYEGISKWIKEELRKNRKVILFAYPLGKSQELISLINKYLNLAPHISWDIYYFCEVYKKFGLNLDYNIISDIKDSEILVLPKAFANAEFFKALRFQGIKFSSAYFSGWALKNNFSLFHKTFPLSDHADFNQLLQYVEQSNAKKIYTYHGFAKEFANYLRKKGYNASILSNTNILSY